VTRRGRPMARISAPRSTPGESSAARPVPPAPATAWKQDR
jgi:hypothetical protein